MKFRWKPGHKPEYKTSLSTGADLKSTKDITIPGRTCVLIPLGVWIDECDDLLDIQLRARSSTFRKWDLLLANGVGTIDADYRDEIAAPMYNTLSHPVTVPAGTPLVQLVVCPAIDHPEFNRGGQQRLGGFGSTDRDGVEL